MTKKLLFTLGAASLSVAPVVAIVSCSGESVNSDVDKQFDDELKKQPVDYNGKTQIKASEVTVDLLKKNSNKNDSTNPANKDEFVKYEFQNLKPDDSKGILKFEIRINVNRTENGKKYEGYSNWKSVEISGFKTA